MRIITPSSFVLETLGGLLSGHNLENDNHIAHVMRAIFKTPADTNTTELVRLKPRFIHLDLGMPHVRGVTDELLNAESDLINGAYLSAIVGDLSHMLLIPLCDGQSSESQMRLNTAVYDGLIQHLVYFGYWYGLEFYPNELH